MPLDVQVFITKRLGMLEVLQAERNSYEVETWVYTKEW
jgi:hypothetical protein